MDQELLLEESEEKPKWYRKKGYLITGIILVVALLTSAGLYFFWDKLFINKNYQLSLMHIQAHDFQAAESALRLCLVEEPNNKRAKAMLGYVIVRADLEDKDFSDEELVRRYIEPSLVFGAVLQLKDSLGSIRDPASRDWMKENIKDAEEMLRTNLKKLRIPIRDWTELQWGALAAAKDIFKITVDTSDQRDILAKNLVATILARTGNREAAKHLALESKSDETALLLSLAAGGEVNKYLQEELEKTDSFLQDEGSSYFRKMQLVEVILDFVEAYPSLRRMRQSDFPENQVAVFTDAYKYGDNAFDELLALDMEQWFLLYEAYLQKKFDLTAVNVRQWDYEKVKIASIGGFDAKVGKYICRLFIWDKNQWQPIKIAHTDGSTKERWVHYLPMGTDLHYNQKEKTIAIATLMAKSVKRSRTEWREKKVTRYRQERGYNSRKYYDDYYGYYGGYELVSVPYQDIEEYEVNVPYNEVVAGYNWSFYKLNQSTNTLSRTKEKWTEYGWLE